MFVRETISSQKWKWRRTTHAFSGDDVDLIRKEAWIVFSLTNRFSMDLILANTKKQLIEYDKGGE